MLTRPLHYSHATTTDRYTSVAVRVIPYATFNIGIKDIFECFMMVLN